MNDEVNTAAAPIAPNAENRYEVSTDDLPLSCPMPRMSLWNSHPKVYLPVEDKGEAKCPYCGAVYVLRKFQGVRSLETSTRES